MASPHPTALPPGITAPPPPLAHTLVSFPTPQILLATINRPAQMNCINTAGHREMHALFEWYDAQPALRCAVVTGAAGGRKDAFCAGQDLKEWHTSVTTPTTPTAASGPSHPPSGFAGLSQRTGKKPVIAAVHGLAFGGGLELLLNTDLSLCTPASTFSLPESSIGVAAFAGALPRLALLVGLPRASELAYTGRVLTGAEAAAWGIVNRVVPGGRDEVLAAAVAMAESVCGMSPDSVVVSRLGLRSAWEGGGVAEKVAGVWEGAGARLRAGENVKEGLRSFVEGRRPSWRDSKL